MLKDLTQKFCQASIWLLWEQTFRARYFQIMSQGSQECFLFKDSMAVQQHSQHPVQTYQLQTDHLIIQFYHNKFFMLYTHFITTLHFNGAITPDNH
jgi:hypothetical protein